MEKVVALRVANPPVTEVTVPVSDRSHSLETVHETEYPLPSGLAHDATPTTVSLWADATVLKATIPTRTSDKASTPWAILRNLWVKRLVVLISFSISLERQWRLVESVAIGWISSLTSPEKDHRVQWQGSVEQRHVTEIHTYSL
jgi:hypothetical protein